MILQQLQGMCCRHVAGWLASAIAQWRTCRECGGSVGPFDRICSVCGASSPVRISVVQTTVIVTAIAEAFLLMNVA